MVHWDEAWRIMAARDRLDALRRRKVYKKGDYVTETLSKCRMRTWDDLMSLFFFKIYLVSTQRTLRFSFGGDFAYGDELRVDIPALA
jgi:hypothetical protein